MYMNYRRRGCNCGCNYNNTSAQEDVIEESCPIMEDVFGANQNECECGFDEPESLFPENPVLAQSYVPFQRMKKTFTPEAALQNGTLFPELVSPYVPGQSLAEIEYLKATNEIKGGCNDVRI